MSKKEVFDLIVKGFGVYLLVLAIIAIPKMFGALVMLPFMCLGHDPGNEWLAKMRPALISQNVEEIVKFIIYIIASVNFLRSGSFVKKLMGCEKVAEQDNQSSAT